ncbi:MAG: S9 family peptidase [Bacteroidota bacterium]|nr:S9 family peptidase [Bacteroidota bacterium]
MKRLTILITLLLITSYVYTQEKNLTLEEIWKEWKFTPNNIKGFNSMNDGEHYSTMEKNKDGQTINKYAFKNGKKIKTFFNSSNFKIEQINKYYFNEDETKLLLATQTERIYRHSSKSIYYIYNIHTDKLEKVLDEKIMYPSFSPKGNNLAYVFENNLYIKDMNTKAITKVTTDGEKNKILNGISDWVYEEEFTLKRAFEWSPDGSKIAYYKFDETHVNNFSMDVFKGELYPKQIQFKYPKAGEANSVVRIYFYDLEKKKSSHIYTEKDYEYIPRIKWTKNDNVLALYGMNRYQNELDFILADANDNTNRILFTETDKYYIDVHDDLLFLPNNYFIWTSEKDGFKHIYLKGFDGSEEQLTKGDWEVSRFHGVDSDNMMLFYSSTEEGSTNRSLYSFDITTKTKTKINQQIGNNSIYFSSGMKYFLNTYSTANKPYYISLHKANGSLIKVLEDNQDLQELTSTYALGEKELFTIKTEKGIELNAWMIKPLNFDKDKQYPLFMFLYGGPGSQSVMNSWGHTNYFWYQYLAQKGYIVACVDNRGTGGKGAEFKKMTYQELGKYETIDQIDAAKYFGKLDYIDKNRIGIQGWSYGGYMSSLAITKGADIFSLAIAIAPVTNWRYYDNIYTERYMRTPQENPKGYDDNSPINHVAKMKGKYLLVHGSADDNVHLQNTYEMVSALVEADKQFELFIYPDRNHGIYGKNTRYHLYKKMTNFILENL